jgi:adenosylcobyric acid synthase
VLLGICGGFQMLGREVADPDGVEDASAATVPGLDLLDVRTTFRAEKTLGLPRSAFEGFLVTGYEIHHGAVTVGTGLDPFPGGARAGRVLGTMWHGTLEVDAFRAAVLAMLGERDASPVRFAEARRARLDLLGDLVEAHLDVDALLALAHDGPPRVPVLPRGTT